MTVPTSIKPKPNECISAATSAFLSSPAASPIGLGNFIPNNSLSKLGLFTPYKLLKIDFTPGILNPFFNNPKVTLCAFSACSLNNRGLKRNLYIESYLQQKYHWSAAPTSKITV